MILLNRLREIRNNLGLSLDQVSILSGISKSTLSEIERGLQIPNQLTIISICDSIDMPAHHVFVFTLRKHG